VSGSFMSGMHPRNHLAVTLLWLSVMLALTWAACAQEGPQEKSVSLNTEVAAGTWKGIRLRRLPKGASLRFELNTSGPIVFYVIDSESYRRLPGIVKPLLKAETSDRITVSLIVPKSGTYYAIIDNQTGKETRKLSIAVHAVAPARPSLTGAPPEEAI